MGIRSLGVAVGEALLMPTTGGAGVLDIGRMAMRFIARRGRRYRAARHWPVRRPTIVRVVVAVIALVAWAVPAVALTTYYVDPNWSGLNTGAATAPWTSLASGWGTINTTLATDDVTVYFSARLAGSDTNVTNGVPLSLDRTDLGTHRLTLDGMSQYNTSEVTPSWSAYSGASRHQITGSLPVNSNNANGPGGPWPDRNYITVQGFKLISTGGQCANLEGVHNFIFQNNDASTAVGVTGGPCVFSGVPYASNAGAHGGTWPTHLQIVNNTIHDTFGECMYIGGATPDPPPAGQLTNLQTGDDILIQGNTSTNCGIRGGEPDGIDVKDGNTNVKLIGNTFKWPIAATATAQAMDLESCTLVDGNYVEFPPVIGISLNASWNNTVGRGSCVVRNNVIVNITSPLGSRRIGIALSEATSVTYQWTNTKVYNNTIFNTADSCIHIFAPENNVTIENNILDSCGGDGITVDGAGQLATHDYNVFFNITGSALANAGINTACANVATVEPHSLCSDPPFVNTSTPYTATNFRLRAGSPAIGAGVNLSSIFTTDFTGATRGVLWDTGAFQSTTITLPPQPPTLSVK
jgi:hypothetical protein